MNIDWWDDEDFDGDMEEPEDPFAGQELSDFTKEILKDLGYESIEGVLFDLSDVDVSKIQGARFSSLEEAIIYLHDAGILSFFGVVRTGEDDFGVFENYP